MLMVLLTGFALSQAYRSVTALIATGLQADFGLSSQALGLFAGVFAFAFGGMQLFMGASIDLYGVRRTILVCFPLAIAGAVLSALAPSFGWLLLAQALIGVGCAPAFLVCTVFIARYFAAERFAVVSGISMGVGGLGMIFTGTPLAWLVQASSWRTGFALLAALSVLAWLLMYWRVHEAPVPAVLADAQSTSPPGWGSVLRGYGALFRLPHTAGILALSLMTYAAFLTLRGLWLGPLLIERHGFSLVASGNVAMLVSVVALFSPTLFGRLDPGPQKRRRWIVRMALLLAALLVVQGWLNQTWADVAGPLLMALIMGYSVLQYADVRSAYPAHMTGRALAVFTMAMFLGVALMQWATGWAAGLASAHGADPYLAVLIAMGALLAAGALAFRYLPAPPGTAP